MTGHSFPVKDSLNIAAHNEFFLVVKTFCLHQVSTDGEITHLAGAPSDCDCKVLLRVHVQQILLVLFKEIVFVSYLDF